ncbi:MAG: DnaD domain protein [Oscillospiraceae bacterium]
MKFHLLKQGLTGIEVPKIVFDNLLTARESDLKVVLYLLSQNQINPVDISVQLNITLASVNSSLLFWSDKGLLLYEEDKDSSKEPPRPSLSSEDIIQISRTVPDIGILISQLQNIYGKALNEKTTNGFVGLYLQQSIPVDVILTVAMHFSQSEKGPAYAIKVVETWFTKHGVTDGGKAEEYIALLDKRGENYNSVGKIFSLDSGKFNTGEKTIIDSWFERLHMSLDMIKCSFETAGANSSVRYCNGILKSWANKGYNKPSDLENEVSNNIPLSPKNIDAQDDLILQGMSVVPVFNKGE